MQIEPMPSEDGWRCWLSEREQELLVEHADPRPDEDDPRRTLAVELMLDGLRSEETTRVSKNDVRRLDAEGEAYCLRVWEGKTGYRECPVSTQTKERIFMLASMPGFGQDDPLIDVSPRTVQRWVAEDAAPALAEQTGDDDWLKVSAHDLRRTWGTHAYYRLISSGGTNDVREIVMRWGGWDDEDTFRNNYLGRVPDGLSAELMASAGLA
ncbi:hypothetical protein AUR64_17310 [Haloprofundus marisrubri]|uniref:Tyr recombinase domain-containing protein n=1 Tax=Haloprofundus marisrubri TaxID=1514971 RepID=A0A0W1R9Z5_9EURY|nr:site-specific integrase [Haloprofundus marisrubri]KTG09525.1 hypothetical protein AUR64_17310 [Haloprofundus marisrubri]